MDSNRDISSMTANPGMVAKRHAMKFFDSAEWAVRAKDGLPDLPLESFDLNISGHMEAVKCTGCSPLTPAN